MTKSKLICVLCITIVLPLVVVACAPSAPVSSVQQTATALQGTFSSQFFSATQQSFFLTAQSQPPFLVVTPIGIPINPPPLGTLIALTAQPCALVRVTEELIEVTSVARSAFARVEALNGAQVRVEAVGENCFEADGSLRYFMAQSTNVLMTASVESLSSLEPIAQLVLVAYEILSATLTQKLPASLGSLELTLTAGEAVGTLRTSFNQIVGARAEGFTGGALVDALGGVVQSESDNNG
jgi:hypothetical protein